MRALSRAVDFFSTGIFEIRLKDLSSPRAFFLGWLRVLVLAFHGFMEDSCAMRASSLTYYSLFAIVPVLAMAFGIASGFGLENLAEQRIAALAQQMNWPPQVIDRIIAFSHSMLGRAKIGLIAGAGFVVLFWSVLSIAQTVEQTLNHIWQVRESRTFTRRVTDYLAMIFFTPILLVLSSSVAIVLQSEVLKIGGEIGPVGILRPVAVGVLWTVPYLSICAILTLTYLVIPNTKVRVGSAVIAGMLTGTIYQTVQFVYIKFQIGVYSYGAVYGGFATVPLFIVWLRLSWMMVLYGAEVAVPHENRETYGYRPTISSLSIWSTRILFLRLFHVIAKRFGEARPALTPRQMSEGLEIPLRLVRQLLDRLVEAGLAAKVVHHPGQEPVFQPARSTERMHIQEVVEACDAIGDRPEAAEAGGGGERVSSVLRSLTEATRELPGNIPLKEV